jgi:predicted anti-sigma-YlaC factor YlaD
MNCEQLRYDLSVEVLTRGRHPQTAAVTAHLDHCPECRHVYDDLKKTAILLSLLGQDAGPPDGNPLPMPAWPPSRRTATTRRKTRRNGPSPDTDRTRCTPARWRTEPSGPPRTHHP